MFGLAPLYSHLRGGSWSNEEETYAHGIIAAFKARDLPVGDIEEGTSLRKYLSRKLLCSPKRVSKKFEGTGYNGKQVYIKSPSASINSNSGAMPSQTAGHVLVLERIFLASLSSNPIADNNAQATRAAPNPGRNQMGNRMPAAAGSGAGSGTGTITRQSMEGSPQDMTTTSWLESRNEAVVPTTSKYRHSTATGEYGGSWLNAHLSYQNAGSGLATAPWPGVAFPNNNTAGLPSNLCSLVQHPPPSSIHLTMPNRQTTTGRNVLDRLLLEQELRNSMTTMPNTNATNGVPSRGAGQSRTSSTGTNLPNLASLLESMKKQDQRTRDRVTAQLVNGVSNQQGCFARPESVDACSHGVEPLMSLSEGEMRLKRYLLIDQHRRQQQQQQQGARPSAPGDGAAKRRKLF